MNSQFHYLFVDENGSGKSTMLEAIAIAAGFNPEGRTRNYRFATHDTHSPILSGIPGAEILTIDDGRVHPCKYEDTDSCQVTEMFINNRRQLLKRLLDNEQGTYDRL